MANNDASQMRKYLTLMESQSVQSQQVEEAFPILKQQLKSKLTGLAAKFSRRMAGKNLLQKALVPYLQMFATVMGRKQQNWDTVTWKTVADYMTSSASLRLPMGEFEPQRLTVQELDELFHDADARAMIRKYVPGNAVNLSALMPQAGIRSVLNRPVSAPVAEDKSGVVQKFITGLMVAVIQKLLDKAEGVGEYSSGQAGAPAGGAQQATATPQQPAAQQATATPQQPASQQATATPQPAAQQPLTREEINQIRRNIGLPPL